VRPRAGTATRRRGGVSLRAWPRVLALLFAIAGHAVAADAIATARALEDRGDVAAAADAWLEAWNGAPGSKEAGLGLARTAIAAERSALYRRAEVALAGLLHAAPGDGDLLTAIGEILLVEAREADSANLAKVLAFRARGHLQAAVDAGADGAKAVRLLARAIDRCGEPALAVQTIDDWLGKGHEAPPSLIYEKGRILYDDAVKRHADAGGAYPLPPDVRRDLSRARDLFYAATVASPGDVDAWIHLAWAAQRIGEFEDARLGYERALVLGQDGALPLRGLYALYAGNEAAFDACLKTLIAAHPEAGKVIVFQAWRKLDAGETDEAERLLELFASQVPDDADANFLLGRILRDRGDVEEAQAHFWSALAADPRHLGAAEALDAAIRARGLALAKQSREGLSAVVSEYERLIAAAPQNPYVRNNLAFLLREAWSAHRDDPAWTDAIQLSAKHYDAAVAIVGRWTAERARSIPWAGRYAYAQMVCDAGVLRQNFEPVKDLVRAEFCYRQSLAWTEWGYLDSWTYLSKLLEDQGRWKELHELALRCANGLRDETGEPLASARDAARAKAARIEADGLLD
jgi:tetratricopeptide (TPR) repeat protein